MINNEELTGTLVLVHPDLKEDPVKKQGQIGMLMYADQENDNMYVTFGQNERALYSSDALLVFQNPNDLYRQLLSDTQNIPIPDFKALMRINLLLDRATGPDTKAAMQLVAENPGTISRAMMSLQDKLGIAVAPELSEQASLSRGR
jgi:hypothetical protein